MAQPRIQASFNSGEWAPSLYARVDIEKYRSGAALLKNFFVDYRGGASTRPGTKYVLQARSSGSAVRLIPFQASFTVGYVLEFGANYVRFYNNGAAVLEGTLAITGATQANPCVVSVVNSYAVGDWVYITGVGGMTQLNGRYFIISARSAGTITLQDLFSANVNSTAYGAYTAGGTVQRVYTISSPYAAADLALLKFVQNTNTLILTHPSYVPYVLTLNAATNWTLAPIVFGSTLAVPTGAAVATTLGAGTVNYAYVVTASDQSGQESAPSAVATLANKLDLRTNPGTNTISWNAVTGATSYNVYKAELSYAGAIPTGASFGFIGNSTGTSLVDSNIAADFAVTPPVTQNPFSGASVIGATITTAGSYTVTPGVTFAAPPTGHTAVGTAIMSLLTAAINNPGAGYSVGNTLSVGSGTNLIVDTLGGGGSIATFHIDRRGAITGAVPATPVSATGGDGTNATFDVTWSVIGIFISSGGDGYLAAPAITFSAGAAAATALLGTASNGNPSCCGFINQRLVLAGPTGNPQQFNMSQPGAYFNYDITNPIQDDDAIQGSLVSGRLNSIKSMVAMPSGLIVLSDQQAWLINGGANGAPVTATSPVANAQSYIGAGDVPPIVSNFDMLFVQSKGAIVRDMSYNFYANVWTGTDISILASHLFYGYSITEWAWAEEPFKLVWAVRSDGVMLTLTFLKEQEFIGWAHSETDGLFKSVATVTESVTNLVGTALGSVDAVYVVVERTINGQTLKYIERVAERNFTQLNYGGVWCVDAGLSYVGVAATTFTGGEHLAGETVTGTANGVVITPFVMPASGSFTLSPAATVVVVGLPFTCDLQTLALDLGSGEATVQGKVKKINAVDVRVTETLGLKIGSSFTSLVPMKDLVLGNVSSMLTGQASQRITGLVTGDARTFLDPTYTVPGQYCIRQDQPYPATVLGVIPQVTVGDTAK